MHSTLFRRRRSLPPRTADAPPETSGARSSRPGWGFRNVQLRLVLAVGACAFGLRVDAGLADLPSSPAATVAFPLPAAHVSVERMRVAFVDAPAIIAEPKGPGMGRATGALGRSYGHRLLAHARRLAPASGNAPSYAVQAGEHGAFDLWEVAAQRPDEDTHETIALEFPIEAGHPGTVYLGLGFSDNCAVAVNGVPVFVCQGSRDRRRNQDLVPLAIVRGRNTITLWCRKAHRWKTIPSDHYTDEWAVEAKLYPTAQSAWEARILNNFHPLDTSIVTTLNDLRAEGHVEGHDRAAIFDLDGNEVARGRVGRDGSVRWARKSRAVRKAFVGLFILGQDSIEPILLTGDASVESIAEGVLARHQGREPNRAWPARVRHLLKTTTDNDRDRWWARKLAVSLVMSGANRSKPSVAALLGRCEVARIEFKEYVSQMDGSRQYYQVYQPPLREGSCPVALILPTSASPVRCFLESVPVAELSTSEHLASAAREAGVAVVLPGYINVDGGGTYATQGLAECIADIGKQCPGLGDRKCYVVGTCSSGITALGAAVAQRGVDGLVLCTPVLHRTTHSRMDGLKLEPIEYPAGTLDFEAWHPYGPRLAGVPTCIIFDADVPGHGDSSGCRHLIENMRSVGTPLEVYWPERQYDVIVWGMRFRDRTLRWMNWIRTNEPDPTLPVVKLVAREESVPATVKEALVRGFYLEATDDPAGRAYWDWWTELVAQYRGERPARNGPSKEADTAVRFRRLADGEGPLMATPWIAGKVIDNPPAQKAHASDPSAPLWGFRLRQSPQGHAQVEVVRTEGEGSDCPRIDLIVGGGCTGALFRRGANGWELLQIGIPEGGPNW